MILHRSFLPPSAFTAHLPRFSEEKRIEFWAQVMLRDSDLSQDDYDIKRDARHRWLTGPDLAQGQDEQGCPCPVCVWQWRIANYQPKEEPEELA